MGFALDSGYTPADVETLMLAVMANINTQFGTAYTYETFVGTNFYKYFYALIQELQKSEVKTSEIFLKLQQYFTITNEAISRPVVTNPGLIEKFSDEGFVASVKKPIDADAGKCYICVDTDELDPDYEDVKLEICTIIKDSVVAGVVTQGAQVEAIVLSNGQSFDFKFDLPDRIEPDLKLTIALSENNEVLVLSPEDVKIKLLANIASRYSLGRNFEPQRYFSIVDAPWAQSVLLEYDIGSGFVSTVYDAAYDDLFVIKLENITLIEV